MKLSTSVVAALTVLASSANGKVVNSKPFYLVLESDNAKLNGTALGTCHEGAGIESLCKGVPISQSNPKFTTFKFQQQTPLNDYGFITYLENVHPRDVQPLGFYNHAGSNVALPIFGLVSDAEYVSFDGQDRLYIKKNGGSKVKLYSWYMCRQKFESYTYNVLSWVYGTDQPDNKTCQKVNVKRVFK